MARLVQAQVLRALAAVLVARMSASSLAGQEASIAPERPCLRTRNRLPELSIATSCACRDRHMSR
jgi:hypothetical protein